MSRIYEALQRASHERISREGSGEPPVADTAESSKLDEPVGIPSELMDATAKYAWTPLAEAIPCLSDRGVVVEQLRGLRSRLSQARHEAPIKTLLVCSGMPAEGKSFVAVNLAISLAREGVNRVLLIDGDLRRPTLHEWLGAPSQPGLYEYLAGTTDILGILQKNSMSQTEKSAVSESVSNLTFIPAGKSHDNSSELLTGAKMSSLIASLAQHFNWIIIDSPPVLAVTDAIDMAQAADAVLLVAREGKTPFQVLQRAQAAFRQSRLLGVILNAAKQVQHKRYYYYSSYYSSYYDDSGSGSEGKRTKTTRSSK